MSLNDKKLEITNENNASIENIEDKKIALASINGLMFYLLDTQKNSLEHINKIIIYNTTKYMSLDINAKKKLRVNRKNER